MQWPYPTHWEADVVLSDGGTAHVRPIRPDDAELLERFHSRLSPESIYLRFFAPYPRLSRRDVERFTTVDYDTRAALIATIGTEMVAVVRYDAVGGERGGDSDRDPGSDHGSDRGSERGSDRGSTGDADRGAGHRGEAEVAFLVEDGQQGRGLGSVLLEHIAAAARERGIRRFVADILPNNRRMINVFLEAGYQIERRFDEGVLQLGFDLEPTETSQAVVFAREHRAEARSIQRLLGPRSVAVVGASREPPGVGHAVLRHLFHGDFQGPVYPVHPEARAIAGVRAYPTVLDIPDDVDLAVVALPADSVLDVVEQCARKGVHGLVTVSSGFGEAGPEGRERQGQLVRLARAHGMRVVGPNCLGIANTDPDVRLNATLAPTIPGRGRVGFFSQSGALGIAILERVAHRRLGLSTFVSAGNRADVSGNDLLQFWEEDDRTDTVLLYLESLGNPRKFIRLARRLARAKPVVAVKSGRTTQGVPLGHAAPEVSLSDPALGALLGQAGIIRVDDLGQLFDVAQLLAYQPLPPGDRVAIVGNSDALGLLAKDACVSAGLHPHDPIDLGPRSSAEDFETALRRLLADDDVDSVVTVFTPPVIAPGSDVAAALARLAASSPKPVVTTFLGYQGLPEELQQVDEHGVPAPGSVPSYPAPEGAVRALAHATRYATWRRRPPGQYPELSDVDQPRARAYVEETLDGAGEPVEISRERAARLLSCYGIAVWPLERVASPEEAAAAAARVGYPVTLRAVPDFGERGDPGGMWRHVTSEEELRRAYDAAAARSGGSEGPEGGVLALQPVAPPGVATAIGGGEDPSFGGLVSFGIAGPAVELLGDRAYRLAPLTDGDAAELARAVHAAPMLFGHGGRPPVDVEALEDLLCRVSRLVDDVPEVERLEMDPVTVGSQGTSVLDVRMRLAQPPPQLDAGPRRLRLPG